MLYKRHPFNPAIPEHRCASGTGVSFDIGAACCRGACLPSRPPRWRARKAAPRRRPRRRPSRCRASGTRAAARSGPTPRASAQIRFLTEFDYPPFNYAGPDGNPAGFNVELARLICEELKLQCTIQLRRFDTLLQALGENRADAVIASLAVTPETRLRVDFSDPYYRAPARFVVRRNATAARRGAGGDRGQEDRRRRRAPRTSSISRRSSPRRS